MNLRQCAYIVNYIGIPFYRLRIGRVTSNNKELVGDHPLVLLVEAVAGVGHQASSRKGQRNLEAVVGVAAEV